MTPRIELEPFEGAAGFAAQRQVWEQLLGAARVHPVFNGPDWVLAWTAAFRASDELFGWTARETSGAAVGLVLLAAQPRTGVLDPRRAALATAGTWDTDYRDLVVRPGWEAPLAEALLDALAARPATDALLLPCVRADAPVLGALRAAAAGRRLPTRELAVPTLVADLAPTLDEHLARLRPRVRTKLRGALRRAEELGVRFHWAADAEQLEAHLEELFALHNARWRAAGKTGAFEDPRRRAFYRAIAPRLLERGELRFARLALDGRPLALQFGFLVDEVYHQLQEGYDPAHTEDRVGLALRARALEALLDEGVRRYDFLAGAARHKREWGAREVPCVDWVCAVPGVRGRLTLGLRALAAAFSAGGR